MRVFLYRKCDFSYRNTASIIYNGYMFCSCTNIPFVVRDSLTKALNRIKEESKGQYLDLVDMNEASRNVANSLHEIVNRNQVEDPNLNGKIMTLSSTMKAYHTRLKNLQNEARALQGDVDVVLKLLCEGNESESRTKVVEHGSSRESPATNLKSTDINYYESVHSVKRETIDSISEEEVKKVETVEGEIVKDNTGYECHKKTEPSDSEEYIEIEIEASESPSSSTYTPTTPKTDSDHKLTIPEITKALYDGGIDFSDCRDVESLRRKHHDFIDGKYKKSSNAYKPQESQKQPPPPKPPQAYNKVYRPPSPNTNETSLGVDLFPNGERKMVDPMKFVHQVKADIAKEKGIPPESIDLWSGNTRLSDHKRMYDYPTIQQYPIEVRNKGYIPGDR